MTIAAQIPWRAWIPARTGKLFVSVKARITPDETNSPSDRTGFRPFLSDRIPKKTTVSISAIGYDAATIPTSKFERLGKVLGSEKTTSPKLNRIRKTEK
jgi:hypothetical protein